MVGVWGGQATLPRGLEPSGTRGELPRLGVVAFEQRWREIPSSRGEPVVVTDLLARFRLAEPWTRARVVRALGLHDHGGGLSAALAFPLAREIVFPAMVTPRAIEQANVWLMPHGHVSGLHFDLGHNLLTVLGGDKELVLFSPAETKNLYPYSALQHETYPSNSQVDLDAVDRSRFPRVARARYWHVTIAAGETLYIPPCFWHFVRSRGESVAVNVWFADIEESRARRELRVPLRLRLNHALARLRRRSRG